MSRARQSPLSPADLARAQALAGQDIPRLLALCGQLASGCNEEELSSLALSIASGADSTGRLQPVVQALAIDDDPSLRLLAARVLRQSLPEAEALHLAQWLACDGDERVEESACKTLGQWCLPGNAVSALLESLLNSEFVRARQRAIRILAAAPHAPEVFVLLRQALHDANWLVRQKVAALLGQTGDLQAAELLRQVLHDSDEDVRHSAALALSQLGDAGAALDTLVHDLQHDQPRVRQSAVEILGQIGDSRAVDALLAALKDSDWALRRSAALALGRIGELAGAVEVLRHDLRDSRWFVRQGAAEALGWLGPPTLAGAALLELLEDADWSVRQSAAEALGRLHDSQAIEALARALADADADVRQSAAEALARLHNSRAAEALLHALTDADSLVRQSAAEELRHIEDSRVEGALIQALADADSEVRQRAIESLGYTGGSTALDALLPALTDEDAYVRRAAAEALGRLPAPDDDRLSAALMQSLQDNNDDVRNSAARALLQPGRGNIHLFTQLVALATIGSVDARFAACLALKHLVANDPQRVFRVALRNLHYPGLDSEHSLLLFEIIGRCALLGVADADEFIQELSQSEEASERSMAALVLGELLPLRPAVAPILLEQPGQDRDWTVREAAAQALARRGIFCIERAARLLHRLCEDDEFAVAFAASAALRQLTGEHWSIGEQRRLHRYTRSTRQISLFDRLLYEMHERRDSGFAISAAAHLFERAMVLEGLLEEPALLATDYTERLLPPEQAAWREEVRRLIHQFLFESVALAGLPALEALERLLRLLPEPLIFAIIYKQVLDDDMRLACRVFYDLASLIEKARASEQPTEQEIHQLRQHLPDRLERLARGFRLLVQFPGGEEYAAVFAALRHLLRASSLSEMLTAMAAAEKELGSERPADDGLRTLFNRLRNAVQPLRHSSEEASRAQRTAPLAEAIYRLEFLSREIDGGMNEPYRMVLQQIFIHWRELLRQEILRLEGRARLEFSTLEEVDAGDMLTLTLSIFNRGPAPASSLRVQLEGRGLADITPHMHTVPALAVDDSVILTFTARSRAEKVIAEFVATYDDLLSRDNQQQHTAAVVVRAAPRAWQHIPNPYLPGRPYPDSATGHRLFVGRADILQFVRENMLESAAERIVVLYGHRRTGKTWILLRLLEDFPAVYLPVYIDVQELKGVNNVPALLQNIADEIVNALQSRGGPGLDDADTPGGPPAAIRIPSWEEYQQNYPYYFKRVFLRDVQARLGERKLLWLVDEFQGLDDMVAAGRLPSSFMEFLRNLMQFGRQMAFIFAGTREMTGHYWSVFFNIAVHRKIGVLKDADADRLIAEPVRSYGVEHDRFALPLIKQLTGNHPYFIQLLCDRIVAELNARQQMLVNAQIIEAAVEDLVINGVSNLKFYWVEVMTEQEQAVAGTVQELLRRQQLADVSAIWSEMSSSNLRLTPDDVLEALRGLTEKDLLQRDRAAMDAYKFKIGLVERYIAAHIVPSDIQRKIGRLW